MYAQFTVIQMIEVLICMICGEDLEVCASISDRKQVEVDSNDEN